MEVLKICPQAEICSGCDHWGEPHSAQLTRKRDRVLALLQEQTHGGKPAEVIVTSLPDRGLRDRLDFQIHGDRRGLWDKERRRILDLDECLQLSPALQVWLSDFRRVDFKIKKGSFRLRVSPEGRRGVWLDFANEDVKRLFDEKTLLTDLAQAAHVEIGQRRKVLAITDEGPKLLKEGPLQTWSRTWTLSGREFPLYSHIGDFSQVGDQANRTIVESLQGLLPNGTQELVEFGAGNGNLTFAAAEKFARVRTLESDSSVQRGFQESLVEFSRLFPKISIESEIGDFQKRPVAWGQADTLLVNPPRSGIGGLFQGLQDSKISNLIYMSCYPESMARDLGGLDSDWRLRKITLIDQFPQTDHVETLTLWQR